MNQEAWWSGSINARFGVTAMFFPDAGSIGEVTDSSTMANATSALIETKSLKPAQLLPVVKN